MEKEKNVFLALWHANSRKVAFGLLLFATATALGLKGFLNSEQWMLCMASVSALIGGGTLLDQHLKNKNVSPSTLPPVAR